MHQNHHPVHKDHGQAALDRFQMVIAIAVTIIATLSALVGLKNKSTSLAISLCQVRGNDLWSWYQAKSVKHSLAEDRADIGRAELEDPQVDDAKKKYGSSGKSVGENRGWKPDERGGAACEAQPVERAPAKVPLAQA